MKARMVPVRVRGVAMDGKDSTPAIILGEEAGPRVLAVLSGPFEASAVILSLEGVTTPRPLTHDLLASLMADHGLKLEAIELYGAVEDGFLARMRYRRGPFRYSREVRPSDGVALALRAGAPIMADPALFDFTTASRFISPADGEDSADLYYLEPAWGPSARA